MKSFATVIILLTISPIVASSTIFFLDHQYGSDYPNTATILGATIGGLISIPLWITYIPALFITPLVMKKVASDDRFKSMHVSLLLILSLLAGALIGIVVMMPIIGLTLIDKDLKWAMNWTYSGCLSGSISSCLIVIVYKHNS